MKKLGRIENGIRRTAKRRLLRKPEQNRNLPKKRYGSYNTYQGVGYDLRQKKQKLSKDFHTGTENDSKFFWRAAQNYSRKTF